MSSHNLSTRLSNRHLVSLIAVLALARCTAASGSDENPSSDDESELPSTTGSDTTDPEDSATSAEPTETGADGFALGEPCLADDDCASRICADPFSVGKQVCSECRDAAMCSESGEGINCTIPLNGPWPEYYTCTNGMLGEACGEPEHCSEGGPHCTLLFPGNTLSATCSKCTTTEDCPDDQLCGLPYTDGPQFATYRECIPSGSYPDGAPCWPEDDGDAACAGYCGPIPDAPSFFVCGECRVDEGHCPDMMTCKPAWFDNEAQVLVPAACVESEI